MVAMLCTWSFGATAEAVALERPRTGAGEFQQPEPKKKEITATVARSTENEQIKLNVFFPEDTRQLSCTLFNLLGRRIEVHPTTAVAAGSYAFSFSTHNLPNGPYIIVLEANGQRIIQKVMLAR